MRPDEVGTGPERSSKFIFNDVYQALSNDGLVDPRHIEVAVEEGIVTLNGEVETPDLKQRAQACVEHLEGVVEVVNNLKVRGSGNFMRQEGSH